MVVPVYLYAPNIVGYFRLVCLFFGLFIIGAHPILGCSLFISNLILDAVDGYLARRLSQVSSFGAILDYAVDRISFATYAMLLASVYPEYVLILCVFLNLDLGSHFLHLKASYALKRNSHKEVKRDDPWILRLYYKRVVLGVTCLAHDLFFIFLYLYHFLPGTGLQVCLYLTLPGALFKMGVHFAQVSFASRNLLLSKKSFEG